MRRSIITFFAASTMVAAFVVAGMPSAAHATARGHNGLIAFVHKGQIITVDSNGRHRTQLTHAKHLLPASSPKWAPDGRHIAYVQLGNFGVPFIWVMRANGTHKHRLWKGTDPAWSPNGKRLAYVAEEILPPTDPNPGCVYHEIFTRPVTGGSARLIDDNGLSSCTASSPIINYGPDLAWSQNQKLVYAGIEQIGPDGADTSHFIIVQLVIGAHTAGTDAGPTGTTSTVVLKRSNAERVHQTAVPEPPSVDAAPLKDNIVYSESYATDEVKAGLVREETANEKFINLLSGATFTSFPVYSPDETKVLYVQHKPGGPTVIRRLNLQTGKSKTFKHGTQPDWQPLP